MIKSGLKTTCGPRTWALNTAPPQADVNSPSHKTGQTVKHVSAHIPRPQEDGCDNEGRLYCIAPCRVPFLSDPAPNRAESRSTHKPAELIAAE